MDIAVSTTLMEEIRDSLETVDNGPRLIAGLELMMENYHRLHGELTDTQLTLAMVEFDRDCLAKEKIELENLADEEWGDDNQELVQRLEAEGIPRHKKVAAIKCLRELTGWGLRDCKNWVEAHYFQAE